MKGWRLLTLLLTLTGALLCSTVGAAQGSSPDSLPASKLRVTAGGTLSLTAGQSTIWEDNPLTPLAYRKRSTNLFRLDNNIHATVKYGDRLTLDLDYHTDRDLGDSKNRLRLSYRGGDFDALQSLQVGHITYQSHNPLISTPGSLFGFTGQVWLGPLQIRFLSSIQRDNFRRITLKGGRRVAPFEHKGSDYEVNKHYFLSEYFARQYDHALEQLPLIRSDIKILRVAVWVESPERAAEATGDVIHVSASQSLALATAPPSGTGEGERIEIPHATQLDPDSYVVNSDLGYISLRFPLPERSRLAISYEYLYRGEVKRVGSFEVDETGSVRAALLADRDKSPQSPLWPLMMKNGYAIGTISRDLEPEELEVRLEYLDPTTGIRTPSTSTGKTWLSLMKWDVQDVNGVGGREDGRFDFIPQATISAATGTLFLPQRHPFTELPSGYPDFGQLYQESKTSAQQRKDLDRFVISGLVSSSSSSTIRLGPQDSETGVRVTQSGRTLTEGVDYVINREHGELRVTSASEEPIEVILPQRYQTTLKKKTLLGLEVEAELLPSLRVGTSVMTYIEDSWRQKIHAGQEDLRNTMIGAHMTYDYSSDRPSRWLSRLIPIDATMPTGLRMRLAYARLYSDYNMPKESQEIVLDGFDDAGTLIDLTAPGRWQLSTTSTGDASQRGHLAWFTVDPLLVREGEARQPLHLRSHPALRQAPLVREFLADELYPTRDVERTYIPIVPMLNLSFYPDERGPYNYRSDGWTAEGKLAHPSESWGSIARPLEINDLESKQITAVETWVLDPFYDHPEQQGGEILLDLGSFSEEVIPDGGLSFESSLPMVPTSHGRRAETIPTARVFSPDGMEQQDVGLDGISSEEEKAFFSSYLETLGASIDREQWVKEGIRMPGSPFDDPSGDDYHFYLGETWDRLEADILERYKYINGTEGNSLPRLIQGVPTQHTDLPDTEDLDSNGVLEERESYFRYCITLSPEELRSGGRWYSGEVVIDDGKRPASRWVKLSIPLARYDEISGLHPTLQSISAVRLTLTRFDKPTHLRLAGFGLITSPWLPYTAEIDEDRTQADLSIKSYSLEEDSGRTPIPYVSPEGITREQRAGVMSLYSDNEKAMAMVLESMQPRQSAAVYRPLDIDLRHYRSLSLRAHAEGAIERGDLELFIRIGSDYSANYYEISQPLTPTPRRDYSKYEAAELRRVIWPEENRILIDLESLTSLKQERDRLSGVDRSRPYSRGPLSIKGHPSLGQVSAVLIGIRSKCAAPLGELEVWVNELSVHGARSMSGDAWTADLTSTVSDLGTVTLKAGQQTAGFGDLRSDVRLQAPLSQSHLSLDTYLDLGRLAPKSWALSAPISYSLHHNRKLPKYDPYDSDLTYEGDDALFYERVEHLSLPTWGVKRTTDRRTGKLAGWEGLTLSYDLRKSERRDTQVIDHHSRRMSSALDYNSSGTDGGYLRIHSGWQRDYDERSTTSLRSEEKEGLSIYHRWLWDRSLSLRWSPSKLGFVSLSSTTVALIDEPLSHTSEGEGERRFRLFSTDILHSIASLGTTDRYQGRYTLSVHTPPLRPRLLRPLYASLTYSSDYSWRRGVIYEDQASGHEIKNNGRLDLLWKYSLSQLRKDDKAGDREEIEVKYRQYGGSTIPGFIPEAGKALGIAHSGHEMAPRLSYLLGIGKYRDEIDHAIRSGWLVEDRSLARLPSYFSTSEASYAVRLHPFRGSTLELYADRLHSKTFIQSNEITGETRQMSGRLRMSTIGLRGDQTRQILDALPERSGEAAAIEAFLGHYLPSAPRGEVRPSMLNLLPGWLVTLDLTTLYAPLRSVLPRLTLKHRYEGSVEVPDYHLMRSGETGEMTEDLNTIVCSDIFNPLIGLDASVRGSLTLSTGIVLRERRSLLIKTMRLLSQADNRYDLAVRYRIKLPKLSHLSLPLLSSSESSLDTGMSYSFTHTSLEQTALKGGTTSRLRGLDSHTMRLTLDYNLSQSLTLRGYWTEEIRKPLVSGREYPYRKSSYGVMVLLSLHP